MDDGQGTSPGPGMVAMGAAAGAEGPVHPGLPATTDMPGAAVTARGVADSCAALAASCRGHADEPLGSELPGCSARFGRLAPRADVAAAAAAAATATATTCTPACQQAPVCAATAASAPPAPALAAAAVAAAAAATLIALRSDSMMSCNAMPQRACKRPAAQQPEHSHREGCGNHCKVRLAGRAELPSCRVRALGLDQSRERADPPVPGVCGVPAEGPVQAASGFS